MKNCELLISVAMNSGVASNLSHDLISAVTLNVDMMPGTELGKVLEIQDRLRQAAAAITEMECRLRKAATFEPK